MTQTKTETFTEVTFIDRTGTEVKISDAVSKAECWYSEKETRWVLAHKAIQKIAALAGISRTFEVTESPTIQPSYKNELEHIVRVTIKCYAKNGKLKKSCLHDENSNVHTATGEANKLNTPVRGRGYLRKMAEKRAYDIAVLEHLGIYDTTFSEEESETMMGRNPADFQAKSVSNVDIEALKDEINMLTDCDSKPKLTNVEKIIKERTDKKAYTEKQLEFLTSMVADRKASIFGVNTEDAPF